MTENTTYDGKPISLPPDNNENTTPPLGGGGTDPGGRGANPEGRGATDQGALTIACNILSWVMVPLFMPVYGLIFAFNFSLLDYLPTVSKWVFVLIDAGINVGFPMIVFFLLWKRGMVADMGLNRRTDRWVPYIVTIVAICLTAWFMWYKGAPKWIVMFFLGGAAGGIVNLVVNYWWKISAHAAGVAGVLALLVRLAKMGFSPHPMLFWIIGWILILGLVGSARVWLGRHTLWQVLAGYAVGFLGVYLMMMI